MGTYSDKAKGIFLNGKHTIVDETKVKCDFIIADAGYGSTMINKFTDHCQTAYNLKVPFIMWWKIDVASFINFPMNDYSRWPEFTASNCPVGVAINRSIMIGGKTKRKINGFILDITQTNTDDGKGVSDGWIKSVAQYITNNVWKLYGIPTWIYCTNNFVESFGRSEVLPVYLSDYDGLVSWKSSSSSTETVNATWNYFPVPPDDYTPAYVYTDPWFFRYANTKFTFDGITDDNLVRVAVPLFMYIETKEKLYDYLKEYGGFLLSDTVPVPVPDNGGGVPDTDTPIPDSKLDYSGIINEIDHIIESLSRVAEILEKANE